MNIKKTKSLLLILTMAMLPTIAKAQTSTTLTNPLGIEDPMQLIGNALTYLMGFLGVIALLIFIFGGFQWMTAAGDAGKVKKGRDTLIWAALGIVVIFSSYALVRMVFGILGLSAGS